MKEGRRGPGRAIQGWVATAARLRMGSTWRIGSCRALIVEHKVGQEENNPEWIAAGQSGTVSTERSG
jgi:hypothetical protein